jgi:hypothetical protein
MRPEHSAAVGIRKGRCNNFVWDQRQRKPTASCYSSCEIIIIKKQNRREKRERKNLSWGIRAISALMSTWYRDCIYIDIKTDATDGPARGKRGGDWWARATTTTLHCDMLDMCRVLHSLYIWTWEIVKKKSTVPRRSLCTRPVICRDLIRHPRRTWWSLLNLHRINVIPSRMMNPS